MRRLSMLPAACLCVILGACAGRTAPVTDETGVDMVRREASAGGALSSARAKRQAIEAYKEFLSAPMSRDERAEAMMRLADLMAEVEDESEEPSPTNRRDYSPSIALYHDILRLFPDRGDGDRVLYQLARRTAQMGQREEAASILKTLVSKYSATLYAPEAWFRLGEIQFAEGRAQDAARSFSRIKDDPTFGERAVYQLAWSRYRLGEDQEALRLFAGLTDRKVVTAGHPSSETARLRPDERELVDDVLRGVALTLDKLGGAAGIEAALDKIGRRPYEALFYRALGDHYAEKTRVQDAASAYAAYVRSHPDAADAITFGDAVVEVYLRGNFPGDALAAKADFIRRFGPGGKWQASASDDVKRDWEPALQASVRDVAKASHARAQRTKSKDDYATAVSWYRYALRHYPRSDDAASMNFNLAEALFDSDRLPEAALEYARVAYSYPPNSNSAEAGYALLVCRERIIDNETSKAPRSPETIRWIEDGERFVRAFPQDPRAPSVAVKGAQRLFDVQEYERAKALAKTVPLERVDRSLAVAAMDLTARSEEAQGHYAAAEEGYRRTIGLAGPEDGPVRKEATERLGSVIYRQGETLRAAGDLRGAASMFSRAEESAPGAKTAPVALFDAAASQAALGENAAAVALFQKLKEKYPQAPLIQQATLQLALAYEAVGRTREAAAEYEAAYASFSDRAEGREALEAAGRLYESLGLLEDAARTYRTGAESATMPPMDRIEFQFRAATTEDRLGRRSEAITRYNRILLDSGEIPDDRVARGRILKARAAYRLAEFEFDDYAEIRLSSPLTETLEMKRRAFQKVLDALGKAISFRVQDVTTAATHRIGEAYELFKAALLESKRPSNLSHSQREQYDFLLEEQARPYEDQAVLAYENNVRLLWNGGTYDDWVKKSLGRLSALRPDRYDRPEPMEATASELSGVAQHHYHQGIASRREGNFVEAEREFRAALDQEPAFRQAAYNLGILYDIYLGRPKEALTYYRTYVKLGGERKDDVEKWIESIEKRTGKPS